MGELWIANTFFVVATVAIVVLTVVIVLVAINLKHILNDVRAISAKGKIISESLSGWFEKKKKNKPHQHGQNKGQS